MIAKARPVSDFLNQRSSLQHLVTEIRHQQQLLQLIQQKLPKNMAKHCHSVVIRDAQVCISVDSPVWSNQLRFEAPNLLSKLRQQVPGVGSIKIRTVPLRGNAAGRKKPRPSAVRRCAESTAEHIQSCAAYIDEGELKNALNQLAKTLRSRCKRQSNQ